MPTLDAAKNLLVIRIVYDGPALSGKTTSLKALAGSVGGRLDCPQERDGRTLYFDWLEYVGGLFEGKQICCQIVSVPGQSELAWRRQRLVEEADAVVCVLDTRRPELEFGISWLAELTPFCRSERPPIGIVIQANKRDAVDAVPRPELRARVDGVAPLPIVESVATNSDGIREAFVLAVRMALDRVRALSSEGRLEHKARSATGAADLLATLHRAESELGARGAASEERKSAAEEREPRARSSFPPTSQAPDERVFAPDPLMPGGMIWPPIDGRALLHEVASLAIRPARTARGEWSGSGAGWRFHSDAQALYADPNTARDRLIAWARAHAANAQLLSSGRAVILADAGSGRQRLWQVMRVEQTLRERLIAALSLAEPREVVDGLIEVGARLLSAREALVRATQGLPCTLWTIGAGAGAPFVGLMPMLRESGAAELSGAALLERELLPHLRALRRIRVDFADVYRDLLGRAELSATGTPARVLGEAARRLD